jgi:hypothetical protein
VAGKQVVVRTVAGVVVVQGRFWRPLPTLHQCTKGDAIASPFVRSWPTTSSPPPSRPRARRTAHW